MTFPQRKPDISNTEMSFDQLDFGFNYEELFLNAGEPPNSISHKEPDYRTGMLAEIANIFGGYKNANIDCYIEILRRYPDIIPPTMIMSEILRPAIHGSVNLDTLLMLDFLVVRLMQIEGLYVMLRRRDPSTMKNVMHDDLADAIGVDTEDILRVRKTVTPENEHLVKKLILRLGLAAASRGYTKYVPRDVPKSEASIHTISQCRVHRAKLVDKRRREISAD